MIDFLLNLDYQVFTWINLNGSFTFGDQFFPMITDLHKDHLFAYIAIPVLLTVFVRKYKRQGLSLFLFLALALTWGDIFGGQVKNYFKRQRPFENSAIISIQKSPAGSKSFYSNHASNMFTFASYMSAFFPPASVPLYGVATLISYSRVYNGVHYPSDVLAGGLLGWLWGFLFSFLAKKILSLVQRKQTEPQDNHT